MSADSNKPQMPDPDRVDALIDDGVPEDAGERELLQFAAYLREGTPDASKELHEKIAGMVRDAETTASPRSRWWFQPAPIAALASLLVGLLVVGGLLMRDGPSMTGDSTTGPAGAPADFSREQAPAAAPSMEASPEVAAPIDDPHAVSFAVSGSDTTEQATVIIAAMRRAGAMVSPVQADARSPERVSIVLRGSRSTVDRAISQARSTAAGAGDVTITPADREAGAALAAVLESPSDTAVRDRWRAVSQQTPVTTDRAGDGPEVQRVVHFIGD